GARVLTPHEGELGRLLGVPSADVAADRFGAARRAADATGATVVLKGYRTLVATPGGALFVCLAGNAVLATAGSGDVLTGVLGALACTVDLERAACAAVYLHALTADRWRERVGADRGMVAGDLVAGLPETLGAVLRGEPAA
ncbi:MAG: NAD(P)H-hydrate dehydratase, partial [Polyangiaceae bacterium]|nr:NAD(P)H-hydrate dehydratase [Polyangiaceae bacterium]